MTTHSNFISAADLAQSLDEGRGYTILASIWKEKGGGGRQQYHSGHLPNALFCDPEKYLSGLPGSRVGRNPLPDPDHVQQAVEKWGIRDDRPVIVYDSGHGEFASRAWWILRWVGIENIQILAGGLAQWEREGHRVVWGPGNISFDHGLKISAGHMPVATIDDVREGNAILLDVRPQDNFTGRRELLDLKAGHIPGSVNVPVEDLYDAHHLPRSVDTVRERCARVGVEPESEVIVYSGSGNLSSLAMAVLEDAGFTHVRHYVGGWSQWSADKNNPIEVGWANTAS